MSGSLLQVAEEVQRSERGSNPEPGKVECAGLRRTGSETLEERKEGGVVYYCVRPRRRPGNASEPQKQALLVSFEDLSKHFNKPLKQACREMGICMTAFKRLCRKLGISKWPYRSVLDGAAEEVEIWSLRPSARGPIPLPQRGSNPRILPPWTLKPKPVPGPSECSQPKHRGRGVVGRRG
mmetsp:Transcript_17988/g.27854  ORF Transcript_17988/g.27854 Transcript_17988/m.27854 type:complete len:180 (-) Transcript_17988:1405-1944(-)